MSDLVVNSKDWFFSHRGSNNVQSSPSGKHVCVMSTHLNPTFVSKTGGLQGYSFIQNIIFGYCKFGNFRVTFISRIFDFLIISETLNLRTGTHTVYKAYCNS